MVYALLHQLLNADELLQVFIAVQTQMVDIWNGDIQEPDHDIESFLVYLQVLVNFEGHHQQSYHNDQCTNRIQNFETDFLEILLLIQGSINILHVKSIGLPQLNMIRGAHQEVFV